MNSNGPGARFTKYLTTILLQIIRQAYSHRYPTITPKLRSTYDGRLIYKTPYEGREVSLTYDSQYGKIV